MYLDLDRFKTVNDTYGHAAGRHRCSSRSPAGCARAVRPEDTVARFGGDEFAVLCEDLADERSASRIADRVLSSLRGPSSLEGRQLHVTPSVGIALAPTRPTPTTLLRNADAAMYRAKDRGKALYELFDERMQAQARALGRPRRPAVAVASDELRLHYQPIIDLDDRPASPASRRCCAGSTRTAGCCSRPTSSRWPRRPASSCPSATGS